MSLFGGEGLELPPNKETCLSTCLSEIGFFLALKIQGCDFIIVKKTHRLHNQNIASQTQKMSTKIKDLQSKALI